MGHHFEAIQSRWMQGAPHFIIDRESPFECFHDFGETSRSWIIRVVAYHEEGVEVSDAVIKRRPGSDAPRAVASW